MSPEPRLKAGEQTDVPSGSFSELFFKDWGWCSLISFNKKQLWAFLPCWGHSWKRRFLGSIWQLVFQASSSQMLPDVWQFHAWFWVRQTTFSGFFFLFFMSHPLSSPILLCLFLLWGWRIKLSTRRRRSWAFFSAFHFYFFQMTLEELESVRALSKEQGFFWGENHGETQQPQKCSTIPQPWALSKDRIPSPKSSACRNLHTLPNSEHMSQLQEMFSRHAAVFLTVGLLWVCQQCC